ncbi:type VI secretion system contractile sheath small subunit [Candidatus Poribacteria bacterium]|nr:type VI secretion system contractile sheath small subunit [Candidatus Poribacteria bacterium]
MLNVPKSRVTIDYVKHTGDAAEKRELPQRMLVVGDFNFKEPDPDDILAERDKVEINQRNFNEVMRKQDVKLNITVPNKLTDKEGEEINVNLDLKDMNSFRPEAIASQIEELNTLLKVRELLIALKSHLVSRRQFRRELERIIKTDLDSAMKELSALGYMPEEESE